MQQNMIIDWQRKALIIVRIYFENVNLTASESEGTDETQWYHCIFILFYFIFWKQVISADATVQKPSGLTADVYSAQADSECWIQPTFCE